MRSILPHQQCTLYDSNVLEQCRCEQSYMIGLYSATSCRVAESKLLFKACTHSHISRQLIQSIAVHLTGFCDAAPMSFVVRSHA